VPKSRGFQFFLDSTDPLNMIILMPLL